MIVSPAVEFTDLDAASAATVVGWVRSAEELALIAGSTLEWPLTGDQLVAAGHEQDRRLRVLLDEGEPVAFGTARRHEGDVRLTLGVFAHNQSALRLYRGLGFAEQPPMPADVAGYHWQKIEMELPPVADQL